jgi:hypothetical protein
LPEIRTIVNMYDEQPGEAGQLHYLLDQIAVRRTELDRLRRDIDETMVELDRVEERCLEDLNALEPGEHAQRCSQRTRSGSARDATRRS